MEGSYQRALNGELCFGTIDTWLMYKLSNKKIFKTDISNASRTMLFNINTKEYDEELLKIFDIPKQLLPEVCPSSYFYGYAETLSPNLKICGISGDQQAALFGQNCFGIGESKNTYGTGCFMLMNIGKEVKLSKNGLITTIAWELNNEVYYALEGSVFIGGASIQWLRDQMRMIKTADESESYALKADMNDDSVVVVPAFVGLGAPYWDDECRGAVFGLTRATSKENFIRAVLNSIALQTKDVIETMKKDTKIDLKVLKVDGGATKNNYLMQYQADILNCKIKLPLCSETTSLGVAYLAGLNSGYWKNLDEIKKIHRYKKEFEPTFDSKKRREIDKKWKLAIKATRIYK